MSYRVLLMVPSMEHPNMKDVCLCELRYTFRKKFIWFGRRYLDISVHLGDFNTIRPIERKEDADLTAQIVYLAMRNLGAEVKVESYKCSPKPIRPDADKIIVEKID